MPEGFRSAAGSARGLEVLFRHSEGDGSITAAYALTNIERALAEERFAPRFERQHTLDLAAELGLGPWGRWSSRLQVGSGQPYTPVTGLGWVGRHDPVDNRFNPGNPTLLLMGEHNSARLPGYFRLDLGVRWRLQADWFGRSMTLSPFATIVNVLNTRNVLVAIPTTDSDAPPVLNFTPQLPFFPTVGLDWSW